MTVFELVYFILFFFVFCYCGWRTCVLGEGYFGLLFIDPGLVHIV